MKNCHEKFDQVLLCIACVDFWPQHASKEVAVHFGLGQGYRAFACTIKSITNKMAYGVRPIDDYTMNRCFRSRVAVLNYSLCECVCVPCDEQHHLPMKGFTLAVLISFGIESTGKKSIRLVLWWNFVFFFY